MEAMVTYLSSLQNKIFKILPMREAYDNGVDNHLFEYIDNLKNNCVGASSLYPELSSAKPFLEVQANLAFLLTDVGMHESFKKWRSIILRSTRLVHNLIETLGEKKGV